MSRPTTENSTHSTRSSNSTYCTNDTHSTQSNRNNHNFRRNVPFSVISLLLGYQLKSLTNLATPTRNKARSYGVSQISKIANIATVPGEGDTHHLAWTPDNFNNFNEGIRIRHNRTTTGNPSVPNNSNAPYAPSSLHGKSKNEPRTNNNNDTPQRKNGKINKPLPRYNGFNFTIPSEPLTWSLPDPSPLRYLSSAEFMEYWMGLKRRANGANGKKDGILPWEVENDEQDDVSGDRGDTQQGQQGQHDKHNIKVPLPIINLNFPKSGTLTMKKYFQCGGVPSVHTHTSTGRIGICMRENLLSSERGEDRAPFHGCDMHQEKVGNNGNNGSNGTTIEQPIGFYSDIGLQGPPCYYASLHDGGLDAIAKHYPHATILLVRRNATDWYRSISRWGNLLRRWGTECGFGGNGGSIKSPKKREEYWINFYHAHTQKVREFAMNHLSMTYVELELEEENVGRKLEYYTGVKEECFMHCHPGPKYLKQNPNATSQCSKVGGRVGDGVGDGVGVGSAEVEDGRDGEDDDSGGGDYNDAEEEDDENGSTA